MKKHIIASLLVASASAQLLSGCITSDLKDMHDATTAMPGLMTKTIAGMDNTNSMMGAMCRGQTKITTSDYRDKLLERIDAEHDIGGKLALAVKYHYAWEFQGMSVECRRNPTYLAEVYDESIREFLERMHHFMTDRSDTSAISQNNKMNSLYALAATMHYVNSLQTEDSMDNHFNPVSMLDLFNDVVNATAQINAGKLSSVNLPAYIDHGRVLLEDMTYLLRLRYNFLTAFSYGLATTNAAGDEATLFQNAGYILESIIKRPWRPEFEIKNTSQIVYYGTILNRALIARTMLETLGVPLMTDKVIYKIYKDIDFSKSEDLTIGSGDPLNVVEKKQAILSLQVLVNDYLTANDMVGPVAAEKK